jgi:hypothetical protein
MSKEIEVEKTSNYLEKEKLYGVSLRSVEPYGRYGWTRKNIYATAHFDKNIDKAFAKAWKDFYIQKGWIDEEDRRADSKQTEIVRITV